MRNKKSKSKNENHREKNPASPAGRQKSKKIFRRRKVLAKISALILVFSVGILTWLFWGLPLPDQITGQEAVSTKIYDRKGNLIYEIFADQRRTPVKLEDLPPYVIDATLAIEDKDFYNHHGFSITGMARAIYKTIFKQKLEGGSTLTQQLIKNTLLTPDRTIKRKIREFVLALLVEARFNKDQILETYLNQIPYGSTAYGIEAASELYFAKSAKDLTLSEASLLAGLPAAPSKYSPFGSKPDLAKSRQETVIGRMVEDQLISREEGDNALREELKFAEQESLNAPHFALWIKDQLAEKYGDAVVEKGGLRVVTTLDLELQEFAQRIVREEVEKLKKSNVGNGAAFVVRPKTGEILAMVGSKDYNARDEDGKVNIIFSLRQPGSSIKPLNYALALQSKKITASTPIADIPTCFSVRGQPSYCPVNYDGGFHGSVQTRFALGNSYNVPAVRVLALNGIEEFVEFARKIGISTFTDPSRYGLSLTLGGGEVSPYDMTQAFATLANQGVKKPLVAFLQITDWKGNILFERDLQNPSEERVLDPEPTFIVSHILLDNNARSQAFGEHSFLNVSGHPEVSVKTGTTNDRRDNWAIGYTEYVVTVAWVGNNDNSPMSGAVSGVSGASPIWNKIMKEVLDKAESGFYDESETRHAWPRQPEGVIGASVCANTGFIPSGDTASCPTRFEYFINGTVPEGGALRQDIVIDQNTGQTENHLIVQDPLKTIICLDCNFPMPRVNIQYSENQ